MSDKPNGGVNFNGPIGGSANVNAADGTFIAGDQKNTKIAGDMTGDMVDSQNKNEVGGDVHGDINQSMAVDCGPVADFFDAVQKEFVTDAAELDDVVKSTFPPFPSHILEEAKANAMKLPPPPEEYMETVNTLTGQQLMTALQAETALDPDHQDPGWISAIVQKSKDYAPIIARAAMSGGEAWLKSKVQTSGILAASIAVISTVREGLTARQTSSTTTPAAKPVEKYKPENMW